MLTDFFFTGVLLVVLSVPLLLGWVKPNPWYGFRFLDDSLINDPKLWYQVNAHGARHLLVVGVVLTLVALLLGHFVVVTSQLYTLVCWVILIVGILLTVLLSWRYLRSISRRRGRQQGKEERKTPQGFLR